MAAPSLRKGSTLAAKISGVVIVLLLALVVAFVCGNLLALLGMAKVTAVGGGGAAFLGTGTLGMMVLGYLLPAATS